jgi:RNA polymerase sigma factor (TIGR02999 family)
MPSAQSVTQLLVKWSEGDDLALEQLTTLVYAELRRLASGYLRRQPGGNTLQATALVHEAYVRLLDLRHIEWQNRAHFIAVAARAMRHILIDHARQHSAHKRGGGARRVPLSRAERVASVEDVNLVALDEALQVFERKYPRQAKVVELHFFGGLKVEEIPAVLCADGETLSQRTIERDLRFARAWLLREVGDE